MLNGERELNLLTVRELFVSRRELEQVAAARFSNHDEGPTGHGTGTTDGADGLRQRKSQEFGGFQVRSSL